MQSIFMPGVTDDEDQSPLLNHDTKNIDDYPVYSTNTIPKRRVKTEPSQLRCLLIYFLLISWISLMVLGVYLSLIYSLPKPVGDETLQTFSETRAFVDLQEIVKISTEENGIGDENDNIKIAGRVTMTEVIFFFIYIFKAKFIIFGVRMENKSINIIK